MSFTGRKAALAAFCRAGCRAAAIGLIALGAAAQPAADDAATRYAALLAEADSYTGYNALLEQQLLAQQSEIASLNAQLLEVDTTALDIEGLLQRMFAELQAFVADDLPFLQGERRERLGRLGDAMANLETTPGEKYRRIMEAAQIELEYGRSMDSYREELTDGRMADFVRLGRVSLMYRTVEDHEVAYWDHEKRQWVVDARFARPIEAALRIAKEESAPDLIAVPVPAPRGERS